MLRISLIISLLLLTAGFSNAFSSISVDTAGVKVHRFDEGNIARYGHDKDFNYETKVEQGSGAFGFLGYLISRFLESLFSVRAGKISLGEVLWYILMLGAAITFVFYVFQIKPRNLFAKASHNIVEYTSQVEDIQHTDFESMTSAAVANRDFRLAVRLFYLKTLARLNEARMIEWQKNKTNFEYYYELKSEKARKDFFELTLLFESAWYGHHEVTEDFYKRNSEEFLRFLQSIT